MRAEEAAKRAVRPLAAEGPQVRLFARLKRIAGRARAPLEFPDETVRAA